jgi:hypothetical protein
MFITANNIGYMHTKKTYRVLPCIGAATRTGHLHY